MNDQNLTDEELMAKVQASNDLLKPSTTPEKPVEAYPDVEVPPAPEPAMSTPVGEAWQNIPQSTSTSLMWSFSLAQLGNIEVSESEKLAYWKGLLNDTHVEYDIVLNGPTPVTVRVRGITVEEQEIIEAALIINERDGLLHGVQGTLTAMQKYCLMFQVLKFNSAIFNGFNRDKCPTLLDCPQYLVDHTAKVLGSMNPAKLLLLCKAILIYEIKIKLCNDAVLNEKEGNSGFWGATGIA